MSVRHNGRPRPEDRRVPVQGRPVGSYPALSPGAERGSVRRVTVVGEEILSRPCREVTARSVLTAVYGRALPVESSAWWVAAQAASIIRKISSSAVSGSAASRASE